MAPQHEEQMRAARALFKFSLVYLSALFCVLLAEALVAKLLHVIGG
jgi:protoheme IX farnesyltransferase